jgi:RNA polymerase sigma-70 factor, ECF subfamily
MRQGPSRGLVEKARAGDPEAIAEIYRRFGPRLHAVAFHLVGQAEDAADIVHDVFLGLPEALENYRHHGRFTSWLKALTVRASLMVLRSTRRRRETSLEHGLARRAQSDATSIIDRLALQRAIAELPELPRQVFMLKVVEGYSHGEIAVLLGISPEASRTNLHRARRTLEQRLRGSP